LFIIPDLMIFQASQHPHRPNTVSKPPADICKGIRTLGSH
jgi:hypothetical protein